MNTTCKLLATAWMAFHSLGTNVHADHVNWEKVSHFFNFDTIVEREKRTNLETNIRLLVEEQLKLPSGQNLWKAFQFWEQQHPELGFQFEFFLMSNPEAEVTLKNLKNSFDGKQIFCFEVTLNEVFTEELETNKILQENILYRPCLIKLIDPDNPNNWHYHLREQELPFFITLAHEFLHALNQLERIDWILMKFGVKNIDELLLKFKIEDFFEKICLLNNLFDEQEKYEFKLYFEFLKENYKSCILGFLDEIISMQKFLMQHLKLDDCCKVLALKYKALWQNKGNDDSLDEMTVILQSKRQISFNETFCIGETTFLQEFYDDDSIVSWSHYSVNSVKFWKKMSVVLGKEYVNNVFNCFYFLTLNLLETHDNSHKENCVFKTYKIKRSDKKKTETKVQTYINSQIPTEEINTIVGIINIEHVGSKFFIKKYIFNDTNIIKLLPRYFVFNN